MAATLGLQGNFQNRSEAAGGTVPETQQTAKPQTAFSPFVAAGENRPAFTLRAVVLGAIFGIIFGGVTVYVGLRAGLTVAASIPIAVISISLLRKDGRPSVLETI